MILLPYSSLSLYCEADKSISCHFPQNNEPILRNYVKENNTQATQRLHLEQYPHGTISLSILSASFY